MVCSQLATKQLHISRSTRWSDFPRHTSSCLPRYLTSTSSLTIFVQTPSKSSAKCRPITPHPPTPPRSAPHRPETISPPPTRTPGTHQHAQHPDEEDPTHRPEKDVLALQLILKLCLAPCRGDVAFGDDAADAWPGGGGVVIRC